MNAASGGPADASTDRKQPASETGDEHERGAWDGPFERIAAWLLARGVRPNHFTFAQIPVFAMEIYAALQGWTWTFVSLIALVIILDGGDGILARVGRMQSRTGAILDSSFDTVGIAIVVWGASQFHPDATWWLWALFVANLMLYLQNAYLGSKVISYLRGPILAGVAFPKAMLAGMVVASIIVIVELTMRIPAMVRTVKTDLGEAA